MKSSWWRTCRKWATRFSPLILVVLAAVCVWGDLRIDGAPGHTDRVPLVLGVYLSPRDETLLESLLGDRELGGSAAWQVEIDADPSGAPAATVEITFGPLLPDINGNTSIGYSASTFSGALTDPVDVVFLLPHAARFPPAALTGGSGDTCARWTTGRTDHRVAARVLRASGTFPDVAVCHIPAVPNFESMQIGISADAPVQSLTESLVGRSTVAVSNPRTLQVTATQDNGTIPPALMYGLGEPYGLYLQPANEWTFSDLQPDPSGVGQQTKQWLVDAGGFISAGMINPHRRTIVDLVAQILLLLAGMFFGLLPAAISVARRSRRHDRDAASHPSSP